MNKVIMIFGAGINQLELIREGKKLGLSTVVIDPGNNPPGKTEADFYYQVAGDDYKETKAIALKHKVNGIVTGQMEKPMRLMAQLASEMGYIFHSPEVVETSLNKSLMKNAFIKNNVPCARGLVFNKGIELSEDKLKNLSYPLIIKPADAFSSRGVRKVSSFDELKAYEKEARSYSSEDAVIIEEFLEGREFSVETITFNGETTVIQVTEKFITPYPNTVEMAHLQPARISSEERTQIEKIVKDAVVAIGIDNSASHAEVKLTNNGLKMIEIGARLGGDFIASYLTKASTGISMDKAAIQVALGIRPDVTPTVSNYAMIKYIALAQGKKVKEIKSLDEIRKNKGYVFSYVFVKPGDVIQRIIHSALRPACILFKANDEKKLFKRIDENEYLIKTKIILQ